MTRSRNIHLVQKLNTNNYASGKFKTEISVIKEELFKVINDGAPTPITTDWLKKHQKGRVIINVAIDDIHIVHVKELNIARKTWNALKIIHK